MNDPLRTFAAPPVKLTIRLTNITTTAMSVRRALAPRSVHLRIVPRPANLSESREIFRVLQRFGEISTYKYLRVRVPPAMKLDGARCSDKLLEAMANCV